MTHPGPLAGYRVCDLTGQVAGSSSTRNLAALGAEVIRVEDPVRKGKWDVLRGMEPYVDERRGNELGGAFNNFNVNKRGVTINLKLAEGRDLFRRLVAVSDVVCENFTAGVMADLGLDFESLKDVKRDIIYVSNCGFGHTGPYSSFRSWGSIVQACSGLTFVSGLPGQPPAGWGYSYMDVHGGNFQAMAVLAGLVRRNRTGEGIAIDMSCIEAAATLHGPVILDHSVNGRPMRRAGMPDSNHSQHPAMAPHNVFPAEGEDNWIAIACRDDADWESLAKAVDEDWARDERYATLSGRLEHQAELDERLAAWTATKDRAALSAALRAAGVPAAPVTRPKERIDDHPSAREWGLFPEVDHPEMGRVRVDGLPVRFSRTDWEIDRAAPLLGADNHEVFGGLLGLSDAEMGRLKAAEVI